MTEWKLIEKIIELSDSKEWLDSKKEWIEISRYVSDEAGVCLCGHRPIYEIIEIQNIVNDKVTIVGNCCINKFENTDFLKTSINRNKFFAALRRNKANIEVIEQGFGDEIINNWEYEFMLCVWKRHKRLSIRQIETKEKINDKLITYYKKRKQQPTSIFDKHTKIIGLSLDEIDEMFKVD